jgi:MFS family permease
MGAMAGRYAGSVQAIRYVVHDPDLLRLEAAEALSWVADWAYLVALGIYAFRAGGSLDVGLAGLIRMLPSAIVAPFAALLGDRYPRRRVLLIVQLAWSAALAGSALTFMVDGPGGLIYGLAAVTGIASTISRPTQAAILPWLAKTSEELVAGNVASSLIESLGTLVGPLLGGVLTAIGDPGVVFAASAGVSLVAAAAIARMHVEGEAMRSGRRQRTGLVHEALGGFGVVSRDPDTRLIVGLCVAQTLVRGALNVLIVVSALTLLKMGESGVGLLTAAIGAGGLVGSVVALNLVGRRLAGPFALALVLWGLPIAAIAVWPRPLMALIFLAVLGAGNSLFDVTTYTLFQRIVPDAVLMRVLGAMFGLAMAAVGLGSILLPPLIDAVGTRPALAITGALLPVIVVVLLRRILRLDRTATAPKRELSLLRNVPIFNPLSVAAMEHLAASMVPRSVPAGTLIIREGEEGNEVFVIAEGEFEVSREGHPVATLGPDGVFGEIALLRGTERSATVTAVVESEVYAIESPEFLAAVTGHSLSHASAAQLMDVRLAELEERSR